MSTRAGRSVSTVVATAMSPRMVLLTFILSWFGFGPWQQAAYALSFTGPNNLPAGGTWPRSVAVGDFDGDGNADLAAATYDSSNVTVRFGEGNGSFDNLTSYPVSETPTALVAADFNADGRVDLAATGLRFAEVSVLLANTTGGFDGPTNFPTGPGGGEPYALVATDLDSDDIADLVVANRMASTISVLLGDGSGVFGSPTSFPTINAPDSLTVGDLNRDSHLDVVVGGQVADSISVRLGDGNGGFQGTHFASAAGPTSVAVGDFNTDARPDVAIVAFDYDSVSFFPGDGNGGLGSPTNLIAAGSRPWALATGEFNGDSVPDLAVGNRATDDVSVLIGDGGGHFSHQEFRVGDDPFALAVSDLDGDRLSDVVAGNHLSNDVSVLLNTTVPGYPRPKGATPLRVPLVLAYRACEVPNRTHGPPLASPSCSPHSKLSSSLTVGSPDANGRAANFEGSMKLEALVGNPATPADEADVRITASVTDIREAGSLTDYAGELGARLTIRLTDRAGDTKPQTMQDLSLTVTVPCAPTVNMSTGSTCALTTTADSVIPGAVPEAKRSVWGLDRVELYDGGPDGQASTTPNTLFATQGIFIP